MDLDRPTSSSLDDLDPEASARVSRVLAALLSAGWSPLVHETYRSPERQEHLASLGRSRVSKDGAHQERRAVDVVDGATVAGHLNLWGASLDSWGLTPEQVEERKAHAEAFFQALGSAARAEGLTWGGGWTSFYDPAHIELPQGLLGKAVGVVDSHPVASIGATVAILAAVILAILAVAALSPRRR